jgi:uridine phosphorylase
VDGGVYATVKSRRQGETVSALTGEIFLADDGAVIGGNLGIGAPAAVAFMEELHACGFEEFILLGSAGTLVNGIGIGDVVLCTKAFCDEGTSQHYTAQNADKTGYPDQHYLQSTREMFERKGIPFKEAVAWTTDAPYRETSEKLDCFLTRGAQVVEMEASALFNAARFRGVKLSAILLIGDSLVDGVWRPHFLDAEIVKAGCDLAERLLVFEPGIVQDA